MEKSFRKCALKANPRPILYFGKQPETAIARNKFFKTKIFEKGLSKTFKKGNFIFSFEPSPF